MQPNEKRILLLGDSITQAWPIADTVFFEGKNFVNKGIGGQTTPQMLERFARNVIAHRPHIVVILGGTNDIAGNTGHMTLEMTMRNLIEMTEMARANRIGVILCSVLPAVDYPWKPGMEPAEKIVALNRMIAAYAEENQVVYADYYTATVDGNKGLKKEFSGDGVHLNKKGYQAMAPVLENAIERVRLDTGNGTP